MCDTFLCCGRFSTQTCEASFQLKWNGKYFCHTTPNIFTAIRCVTCWRETVTFSLSFTSNEAGKNIYFSFFCIKEITRIATAPAPVCFLTWPFCSQVSIYTFLLHDTSDETGEDINAARFSTSLALFRFSNDAELPGLVVLGKPLSDTERNWQMTVLYFVFHLQGV